MADYDSQSDATDIVTIAIEMYDSLCDQQARTMALGDFVAELREYDLTSPSIDQVLQYLISMGWVQVWRDTGEDDSETWITAIVAEDVDGDSGSEQAGGEGEDGGEDGARWS